MTLETRPLNEPLPSPLTEADLAELRALVGADFVHTSWPDRVIYARDMWPRTVLWTLDGKHGPLPWAIVRPGTTAEAAQVYACCHRHAWPIIPFGAGSGVCGATLPSHGGLILDTKRLNRLLAIDRENMVAEIECGLYGETLERRLEAQGLTMGHFPSSIYCSTLGGYLAARSAGQLSSRYGKIEDMLISLEIVLPTGEIMRTPKRGTLGFDWNGLFVGSEGSLGVITRAWMRVQPRPAAREFASFHFKSLGAGIEAMRRVMRAGIEPSVLRLYDPFDTIIAGTHGDAPEEAHESEATRLLANLNSWLDGAKSRAKQEALTLALKRPVLLNLGVQQLRGPCLLVVLTEGEAPLAAHDMANIRELCLACEARDVGDGPARYWLEHRYSVSYKQSKIFAASAWVDTMEVATRWQDIERLYQAVRRAVRHDAFIMAHFSHAYPDGCCLYFSFASGKGDLIARHEETWRRAQRAVLETGGTITHHHGVGLAKRATWLEEIGSLAGPWQRVQALLDPAHIANPGKFGGPA